MQCLCLKDLATQSLFVYFVVSDKAKKLLWSIFKDNLLFKKKTKQIQKFRFFPLSSIWYLQIFFEYFVNNFGNSLRLFLSYTQRHPTFAGLSVSKNNLDHFAFLRLKNSLKYEFILGNSSTEENWTQRFHQQQKSTINMQAWNYNELGRFYKDIIIFENSEGEKK